MNSKPVKIVVWIGIFTLWGFLLNDMYLPFKQVKVGEVWRSCTGDADNPFEGENCRDYTVVDVKDDFVLYSYPLGRSTVQHSDSRRNFVRFKNKVKDVD
jgi:hypothetical protein